MSRGLSICVVEDNAINLSVLVAVLSRLPGVHVQGFADPLLALEGCGSKVFDLVLVDYVMPAMNGVDFVRTLRWSDGYRHVPVVMITADNDPGLRLRAVEAGATDFLNKPIDPQELKVRASNLLSLREAQLALTDKARLLSAEVHKATEKLIRQEEEVIWRLARAIELRDGGTGAHISRVATIAEAIARHLGLSDEACRMIYLAAPLHDVGKIGIPDAILNKPGRLSDTEMAVMRNHTEIGLHILAEAESELLRVAAEIAGSHHERWDGTGYPARLSGAAIPIAARIVAVADVFDALCTKRPYKRAWSLDEARAEIRAQSGAHFDPQCVCAFEAAWEVIAPLFEQGDAALCPQSNSSVA